MKYRIQQEQFSNLWLYIKQQTFLIWGMTSNYWKPTAFWNWNSVFSFFVILRKIKQTFECKTKVYNATFYPISIFPPLFTPLWSSLHCAVTLVSAVRSFLHGSEHVLVPNILLEKLFRNTNALLICQIVQIPCVRLTMWAGGTKIKSLWINPSDQWKTPIN